MDVGAGRISYANNTQICISLVVFVARCAQSDLARRVSSIYVWCCIAVISQTHASTRHHDVAA